MSGWPYERAHSPEVSRIGDRDRTEIEFFNGPHTINGVGTFSFLHKHLNWPEPKRSKPGKHANQKAVDLATAPAISAT